jgi:hypothetical protein
MGKVEYSARERGWKNFNHRGHGGSQRKAWLRIWTDCRKELLVAEDAENGPRISWRKTGSGETEDRETLVSARVRRTGGLIAAAVYGTLFGRYFIDPAFVGESMGVALNLDIDRYMDSVRKFNDLVGELAGKLEQISDARDEALKASADLKRQLETTDQRLLDISSAIRQQITLEFAKKAVRAEEAADRGSARLVS